MDLATEELTRFSNLIGLIYEGATDPTLWTRNIMPAMASYFQVPDCVLFTPLHAPRDGGYLFMYGRTQEQYDLYSSRYQASEDVFTNAAIAKNLAFEGNVILGDELVSRQQWLESKLFTECYSSNPNLVQMMTGIVFGLDSTASMSSACSFFRSEIQPNFCETDRTRLNLVLPHISRSLGVMQRLRSSELSVATTLAALDRLSSGALLLDGGGRVAFANRAAKCMLAKGDGLYLRKSAQCAGPGELEADSVSISRAISAAIFATLKRAPDNTAHFSKSVVVPQRSGFGSYIVQFSALGTHSEFGGGQGGYAAIVFLSDSLKKQHIDPAALQSAYGLTPGEARTAIALQEHVSAKDVARVLEISSNTVRTQIRAIYAKLGVDTRTRFVKTMLGLASHQA